MNKKIKTVVDVAKWRMCMGCGACKAVCPQHRIELKNILNDGIRPVVNGIECENCGKCLSVCPGVGMENDTFDGEGIKSLKAGWGNIRALYEGHAQDEEFRYIGSSGGVANALALFCVEQLGMKRVVHTSPDSATPWLNVTSISTNRDELLKTSGSRYSPASPAEGIATIVESDGKSVFIGKPCDVAAHYKATKVLPELAEKTGCTIGIFCAGTPSTQGTLNLIQKIGIDTDSLAEFRYRGRGWPGMCAIRLKNETAFTEKMTYAESWGFVQKYRPLRCYQCPEGTSEFADIACGDPWHQKANPDEPGISLILTRTARGKEILEKAIAAGYLTCTKTDRQALVVAQKNLLEKRRWIAGRLATTRLMGIPAPTFKGFSLWRLWISSSFKSKLKSVYGTIKRIMKRKYWKPVVR